MKIEILGTGCRKCQALAASAETAVQVLGLDCEVEKVTDITEITERGVMMTPALVVNGDVKVSGRVPSVGEVQVILESARA